MPGTMLRAVARRNMWQANAIARGTTACSCNGDPTGTWDGTSEF